MRDLLTLNDGSKPVGAYSFSHFLSDQAMCLYFIKKSAKNGCFSVLGTTSQG